MDKPFEASRCWNCEKLAFDWEDDAYEYADWLEEKYGYYIRVYWSRKCGCFHFTSS